MAESTSQVGTLVTAVDDPTLSRPGL